MPKGPANPERSFGVSVGTVLIAVAGYLLWRGRVSGAEVSGGLAKHGFSASERMAIDRDNALRLFPRLKT